MLRVGWDFLRTEEFGSIIKDISSFLVSIFASFYSLSNNTVNFKVLFNGEKLWEVIQGKTMSFRQNELKNVVACYFSFYLRKKKLPARKFLRKP